MAVLRRSGALLLGLFLLAQGAFAQSSEYKLKAAYLCRFVDFVDWTSDCFAATNSPLVIGILGDDPFGAALDQVAEGREAKGHPLQIRRFKSLDDVKECHILFISAAESSKMPAILKSLEGREILTVSDLSNFAIRGGMIRFFTENNKVRFRINLEAARACKLSISSRLLQAAAEVIKDDPSSP